MAKTSFSAQVLLLDENVGKGVRCGLKPVDGAQVSDVKLLSLVEETKQDDTAGIREDVEGRATSNIEQCVEEGALHSRNRFRPRPHHVAADLFRERRELPISSVGPRAGTNDADAVLTQAPSEVEQRVPGRGKDRGLSDRNTQGVDGRQEVVSDDFERRCAVLPVWRFAEGLRSSDSGHRRHPRV